MSVSATESRPKAAGQASARYDGVTIFLHWTIVLLIAAQWLGAELVDLTPKPMHKLYWSIHISLGVLFAAAVVFHILWRLTSGRKLSPSNEEGWQWATIAVQNLLFWLPLILAALGFGIVLARGWTLFDTIVIPMMPGGSRPLSRQIHEIHEWTAHVVVVLALGHASAALVHRYVMRDGVLRRMLPGR